MQSWGSSRRDRDPWDNRDSGVAGAPTVYCTPAGMFMRLGSRRAEGGMAVVAVIVLIAVLFLSGAVMAFAVSSNVHRVSLVSAEDAVHYAAESAVARGAGALLNTNPCSVAGSPTINGQAVMIWCSPGPTDADTADEDSPTKPARASIPSRQLTPGSCTSTTLPSSSLKMTVWS